MAVAAAMGVMPAAANSCCRRPSRRQTMTQSAVNGSAAITTRVAGLPLAVTTL